MKLYIVDAFTDRPFNGNPAAVCILDAWPDADWMQKIASENNLSNTAFLVRNGQNGICVGSRRSWKWGFVAMRLWRRLLS